MKKYLYAPILILILTSCGSESGIEQTNDNFDRGLVLNSTYDSIIIPAYNDFSNHLLNLEQSIIDFTQNTSEENLNNVRKSWASSYVSWQNIAMFNIRVAEENFYSSIMNIYPCDTAQVNKNIEDSISSISGYSPNSSAASGFPAIGYMIYGLGSDSTQVLSYYTSNESSKFKSYLLALVNQMSYNTDLIINDWNNNKSAFVSSSGNTVSSSLNMIINDYIYHFEKRVREAKIATPSGVRDGNPKVTHVESFYRPDLSKRLLEQSFTSIERFYYGNSFSGLNSGTGLVSYLEALDNTDALLNEIDNQIINIKNKIEMLNDDFTTHINSGDLNKMHEVFFAMQSLVGSLKTDMLSRFNIATDFPDNDGD